MEVAFHPGGEQPVNPPGVSAVVIVHGSPPSTVDACLESLLASRAVDIHVVLVDNASPDGGLACARWTGHAQVSAVSSIRNDGFAAGVNQGLRLVRSNDFILLLNDDAFVTADAVAIMVAKLEANPQAIACAPRVMLANEPDRIDSLGLVLRASGEAFNAYIGQRWSEQIRDGADILGPCFGAALFRPDAFNEATGVGLLDQRYRLYYEDVDWVLRAQRAGWRSVLAIEAMVFHQHAASTRLLGEAVRYELVQRNLLLCAAKNLTWRSALVVWITRLIVHAKGTLTGPYRTQRVRSLLRAAWGLPSALRARRALPRRQSQRGDAELFGYSTGLNPQFDVTTYRSGHTTN